MSALLATLALAFALPAADVTPDAAAEKAFAEFLAAYRARPAMGVKATTVISASDADPAAPAEAEPVVAEGEKVEFALKHLVVPAAAGAPDAKPGRRGVVAIKGFTCWIGDGFLTAVHESNPGAYFRVEDDGSPYYALMAAFSDLPYPDLALAFGEDAPSDVLMQISPKAPNVVPVSVTEAEVDGAPRRFFKLAAEGEAIDLVVDRATDLPVSMRVVISAGPFVPAGGKLVLDHRFTYDLPAAPFDASELAFDPGKRVKVDLFPALVKEPEGRPGRGGQPPAALVGKEVPGLSLPLLEGGTLDLATARGKVLVLDFWATWCGPCKAALPVLHRIAGDFKADDAPVAFYTVNVFEQQVEEGARKKLIGDFWREAKYTLPVALDLTGEAGRRFQIAGIPTTVVVRSDGIIHAVHVGFDKAKLEADVKGAIAALEKPADAGAPEDNAKPEGDATPAGSNG